MIKLADYRTEKAFPVEMRTPEQIALAYAFDMQKKKFIDRMERVYTWADLEKVDDNKLDFLAVENRVLFYNTGLEPAVKRNLIRNSIYSYMKLGTRQALEEMINIVFGEGEVKEWFQYGGQPYYFKIRTSAPMNQESITQFQDMIARVKNARSHLENIDFDRVLRLCLYSCGVCITESYTAIGWEV